MLKLYFIVSLILCMPVLAFAEVKTCADRMGAIDPDWINDSLQDSRENLTSSQKRMNKRIQTKGLNQASMDARVINWHDRPFTKEVKSMGKITDQKKSGDCWIHATTNELKAELIASGMVKKDFQFSRNFFYFYSTLEKVNSYFEEVISQMPTSLAARVFNSDLKLTDSSPEFHIADGGEFPWMMYMINKYGMAPYEAMPDTAVSLNTGAFIRELRRFVIATSDALAKKISSFDSGSGGFTVKELQELRQIKLDGEKQVIDLLTRTLGFPPDVNHPFKFQINQNAKSEKPVYKHFDPLTFAHEIVQVDPSRFVSVSSTPLQPFNKVYQITKNSSIGVGGPNDGEFSEKYLNLNSHRMAQLIKQSIDRGRVVYFAADVMRDMDTDLGIMDPHLFRTDDVVGITPKKVSRRAMVNTGLVNPDHAMAFVGYETDEAGNIMRFKVENSWGRRVGKKGYFSMSIDWFKMYVFEATIERSLLGPREAEIANSTRPLLIDNYQQYFGAN